MGGAAPVHYNARSEPCLSPAPQGNLLQERCDAKHCACRTRPEVRVCSPCRRDGPQHLCAYDEFSKGTELTSAGPYVFRDKQAK